MKRKIVILLMSTIMCFSPVVYADEKDDRINDLEIRVETLESQMADLIGQIEELRALLFGDVSDDEVIGEGSVYIATPSGTSEDGNIPVIFPDGASEYQIGLNAWDMDGSRLSYIYVDGNVTDSLQLACTQTSIMISGNALDVGTHLVEVIQYNGEPEDGDIVFYSTSSYEIMES